MADLIDTEAPNVMEHQIGEENLPDFSVVVIKKEVINIYDSEFESTTSSVQDRKPFFQEEIGSYALEALSSEITDTEYCQSNILNSNKIILGSKPNFVHDEPDHIAHPAKPYQENNVFLANDTELNPNSIDENFFEELVTSYKPKVELHDIQSYLHKSRRFCESCGILFPERNAFETHMQLFHTKTSLAGTSHKNNDLAKRRIYKCTLCDKRFVAPHVLRNHLSNIHRLKNGNERIQTNKRRYRRVLDNKMRKHRCSICGLKFVAPQALKRHLINIHKLNYASVPGQQNCLSITNTVNDIESQNVNRDTTSSWSNTCFHCKKPFVTQKSLIEHLYDILQMKRKNTEIVPVLKSILFKCNKCDINFTSSQFAANHAEHMEMLINWKCTICNRIFKNEDALSHERQHSVTNNFLVYNLEDLDVTKILYKCSKCGIHFTESNFLYHFRDCGLEYSEFINCKICNMSLDYNLKPLHESDKHTEPNYYTIIQCDVISDNPVKSTANKCQAKEKLKELLKSFREVKVVLQKIDSSKLNKLNQLNTEKWSSDECLSDFESSSYEEISNKAPELQNCENASENVWPSSSNTIPQSKDVDFRRRRNLTFYFCKTCKCFVTKHRKKVHLEARCKNISKEACKQCGLMFTTASLMTHRQLHKEKKDLSINHFKFFSLYNGQPINPAKPEALNIKRTVKIPKRHGRRNLTYHYCETCKCFITKFNKAKLHKRKLCKTLSKTSCSYCGLVFISASMMTHRRLHEERKDLTLKNFKFFNLHNGQPMNPLAPEITSIKLSVNLNNEAEVENIRSENIDDSQTMRSLVYYYCASCKCCFTTKKNIHLEARCTKWAISSCKLCGLNFTKLSLKTHMRLHEKIKNLTLKNFKFFNLNNELLMNPPVPEIMNVNQYVDDEAEVGNVEQSEKIDVRPTNRNFMYYYCEACKCCVTGRNVVHLRARCMKLAKSSCKHCGLTFTKTSMIKHMQLHEERKDLLLKDFEFFNFYNGQPRNPPISDVINLDRPINTESKEEHLNNDVEILNRGIPLKTTDWRTKRNLTYYFCGTCKCFVTKFRKEAHLEARCKKISKGACKPCGLMFTTASLMTHRQLHKEKKDLSINHFKFFNLYNGQPINPATPEVLNIKLPGKISKQHGRRNLTYHYCETCKCFITKFNKAKLHKRKLCKTFSKTSCSYCGLMFTSASMMTHRRLHEERKDLTLKNFKFFNLHNGQPMNPLVPEITSIKQSVNNEAEVETIECYKNIDNWHTRVNFTYYYCETCKCFITKFRQDVHLKGRCKKLPKMSCKHCGLMFTKASMVTHLRLHNKNADLSLKDFNFLNLYNGQPMNYIPNVTENKPVNIEPINSETEPENGNISIDIITRVVNEHEPANNEGEAVNLTSPLRMGAERPVDISETERENGNLSIDIMPRVVNEHEPVSNEGKAVNLTSPLRIGAERPVDIEAEVERLLRPINSETERENGNLSIDIMPRVVNEHEPVSNEGEAVNLISPLRIGAERPVDIEAEVECLLRPINSETERENGNLSIDIMPRVANEHEPISNEGGSVNLTSPLRIGAERPVYIEAEVESLLRPINSETEPENRNLSIDIMPPVVKEHEPVNNEGETVNLTSPLCIGAERPVDIEAEVERLLRPINSETGRENGNLSIDIMPRVVNEHEPVSKEGKAVNLTSPLRIEAERPVDIEAEVECLLQPINSDTEPENGNLSIDIMPRVANEHEPVSNEGGSVNLTLPLRIGAERPVYIEAEVESLLRPINSETEPENRNLSIDIMPPVVNEHEPVNNEGETVNLTSENGNLSIDIMPPVVNEHEPVNNEGETVNLTSENGNLSIDIMPLVVNDNKPVNNEDEAVNLTSPLFINNEAEALHFERPLNKVGNENLLENSVSEAVNATAPLRVEAVNEKPFENNESFHFEQHINIETKVIKENRSENYEGESVNVTQLVQIQTENNKLTKNNVSEFLHFERLINIETEFRNEIRSENIQGESVNLISLLHTEPENKKPFANNEAKSLRPGRPINIEAEDVNVNLVENIGGEAVHVTLPLHIEPQSIHFKGPINIEPKVGEIIQLVNNKSPAESVLQPLNIGSDVSCITGAVNNEDRVSNIQLPTNIQAEIEACKQLVNNETDISNILSDFNNKPQVESLAIPINSEAESPIVKVPLNSATSSNNKTEDESENRPVDHDAEVGHIIQSFSNVRRSKSNLMYHYCETCKCYITQFRRQTHLQARCKNLGKVTCETCGLMFTSGSIMTHKRLHVENENLTLNNFTFFNLYSGQPMNPSIPEVENIKETVNAEAGVVNINQPEIINKQILNLEGEVVYKTQPSNEAPKVPHSKISGNPEDWRRKLSLTLYFCETCKCFVTKYKKTAHLKGRCNILTKKTCKRCGLTFTTGSMMTHKRLHEDWKDLTLNNFTFFKLNGQPMNPPLPQVLLIKEPVSVETEVVNIKQPASKQTKGTGTEVPRRNLTYYFCDTCKCFITKYKKDVHLQARCKKYAKSKCKRCGLKFTKASIMTHKRLHTENKELSLKNFKFFNLFNGQSMKVPTPKAVNGKRLVEKSNLTNYYCKTCKCFVSAHKKTAHQQANCTNIFKIPCKHCGLILSDTSFPLHKRLHDERKDLTLNHLKFFDLNSGHAMYPPIPEYPKCAHCTVYFLTITAKNSHICSEVSSLTCHICEIKLSEAAFKLHMTFHQYATDNTNTIESNIVESATILDRIVENDVTENSVTNRSNHKSNETKFHNSLDVPEPPLQRSSDMYSIVYSCRNCSVSVDTYDKAVEHSQTHYDTYEHETPTILCNSCELKIDEACYMEHQNLHESETIFKILHFDSYYLPAENNLWIKHIFKTLPNEEVLDILKNSIYRFECRIKMDVIQEGDPNYTVYKCDQCKCFIEPTSLFKHSDYACFKLRNHPCTVCGIAFNSSASRIDHEKIHNRPGLTTESYRIVVFNRERDSQINRSFCLRKNYVLYKCRNCDVIIENPQESSRLHKCDFTNVKHCPHCALLLNTEDYESHLSIHKKFISFNYSNMKVVLLGESNSLEIRSENNLRSKFKGAIYDYKMFVCNKCEICIRNEDFMPKHICRFGKQRLKCLKCGLYFSVGRLKTHLRRHEQDPDFIRSNMFIISFDPCTLDQNKNATKLFTKDKSCELSDSNTDSDLECLSANDTAMGNDTETADVTTESVEEETARIYKCSCELHFLNEDSIFRHFGTCRSNHKITKLKCHKCELLFTPNVLFTHLLAHHNNKGRRYKYDIIKVHHD